MKVATTIIIPTRVVAEQRYWNVNCFFCPLIIRIKFYRLIRISDYLCIFSFVMLSVKPVAQICCYNPGSERVLVNQWLSDVSNLKKTFKGNN